MEQSNQALSDLLTRGVANIIPSPDSLEKLLKSGKKLNIYHGIDPTAPHVHLGHATHLRRLQKFSELGHNVTFLIGNFTALIGDTSDKETERPVLTNDQIEQNFQTYKQQAEKIVDFSKVTLKHNSEWLSKLSFEDIIKLCQHFSAGDFYSRELIKKRLTAGERVGLHELLYPVMQGYDSYYMDTDLQIGGTDQTFNMQAGRTLQNKLRSKESFVLAGEFLTGTDGRKMSKSWGNAIWLDDSPTDIYGKVMSIRDDLIIEYFTLATNLPMKEIDFYQKELAGGKHPMDYKKILAWNITSELYDEPSATTAEKHFQQTVQQGSTPTDIPEFATSQTTWNPLDLLVAAQLAESRATARRLVEQGGLEIDNSQVSDWKASVTIKNGSVIQAGKRKFVRLSIQ